MSNFEKITFSSPREKFDIQLGDANKAEAKVVHIFANLEFELKTETWQWRRTGNIAIEYQWNGEPSCLAATPADIWIHELRDDDGQTMMYLMFPIDRLKSLARWCLKRGLGVSGGDFRASKIVKIPLDDIVRWLKANGSP